MAKQTPSTASKKTTKKVTKKATVSKKAPATKAPKKSTKSEAGPVSKSQGDALNAANTIQMYQINTARDLVMKKKKEDIVNSSENFFEAVMKTLFVAGFELAELDPALSENKLGNLPYGNFFMRLTHKNFNKLGGAGYTPNLFLMITNDHNRIVVAKYCVHFATTDTTILMPANLRGDWNFNWNQKKKDWFLITQPKINAFLDKHPVLISFIEKMKARKIDDKESDAIKKDIATEFMNPSRINGRKLLWNKSDKKEFHHKPIFEKENNLFEAVANIVALFTAKGGQEGIRRSISDRTGKEYIYYAYCMPEVWDKKNGKLADGDIMEGKIAVPVTFSRRTYFTYSNITESVTKYLDDNMERLASFGA